MQIKQPGGFSRGKIILGGPAPHITPEALLQELTQYWGSQGFQVYKSALVGLDVAIKKSGWTGVAIKIKQDGTGTVLAYNAFSPSAMVRMLALGLIPLLILNAKSWKPMLRDFEKYVQGSPFFGGAQQLQQANVQYQQQQAAPQQHYQQQAAAQHQQHYQQVQAAPQQHYQQQAAAQHQYQQQQAAPQQYPCQSCQTPLQWVAQHQRWYCGTCAQYL